ncbi:putative small terminase [Polaromonas phage Tiera]|nr:putative small terminase [Polaromonas phage Tiera]
MREQIMQYLAAGIPGARTATILGVSPSYISQCLADEDFMEELTKMKQEETANAVVSTLDTRYSALENDLVRSLLDDVPSMEVKEKIVLLREVAAVQEKRYLRKNPLIQPPSAPGTVTIVNLMLPNHQIPAPPKVILNSESEIVAIEGQSMAPLSSDGVKNMFAAMRAKKEEEKLALLEPVSSIPKDF